MIVIADTSPLHYLILLGHAEVLRQLYGRVIIPEAVVRELQAHRTPTTVRQWIASPPEWLEMRQAAVPLDPALAQLDAGEREAIALAEALRADALILDERAGRQEAERRKLRVIGTVRVLDDAAEAGLVDLPNTLERQLNPPIRCCSEATGSKQNGTCRKVVELGEKDSTTAPERIDETEAVRKRLEVSYWQTDSLAGHTPRHHRVKNRIDKPPAISLGELTEPRVRSLRCCSRIRQSDQHR